MPLMSSTEFHRRKNILRKGHKNPIASDIHILLRAYEDPNSSPNRKLKILVLLYFLCLEYVWSKNGTKKSGFDPDSGKNRNNHVVRLKGQIEAEAKTFAFIQNVTNKMGGVSYKNGQQKPQPLHQGPGTTLKSGYHVETVAPQKNFVAKFNLATKVPAVGLSMLMQETELAFQLQGMGAQDSARAAHQKINNLSMVGLFQELHKLWNQSNLPKDMEFTFFDSAQRQNYLASCTGGVWSCNGKTPFTTDGKMMYVIDLNYRVYIADGIRVGNGEFNHSSMLSGKPVLCAGELEINRSGKLVYIDNNSGHYKPNTKALRDAVDVLIRHHGVMSFGLRVMDMAQGDTEYTAQRFLAMH